MKTKASRELEAAAHHEAGHAVVSWHYNIGFNCVSTDPNKNFLSEKFLADRKSLEDISYLEAQTHIVILLAGQIAECQFLGQTTFLEATVRKGMWTDTGRCCERQVLWALSELIVPIVGGFGIATYDAYLNYCFALSRDIVDVRWKEIRDVASNLVLRQTLKHDEALDIIGLCSTPLRFIDSIRRARVLPRSHRRFSK